MNSYHFFSFIKYLIFISALLIKYININSSIINKEKFINILICFFFALSGITTKINKKSIFNLLIKNKLDYLTPISIGILTFIIINTADNTLNNLKSNFILAHENSWILTTVILMSIILWSINQLNINPKTIITLSFIVYLSYVTIKSDIKTPFNQTDITLSSIGDIRALSYFIFFYIGFLLKEKWLKHKTSDIHNNYLNIAYEIIKLSSIYLYIFKFIPLEKIRLISIYKTETVLIITSTIIIFLTDKKLSLYLKNKTQ